MTPPTPTKKLFTLVLIHDRPNGRVLLGRKKRGIGQGNWNGFGGKVEKDKDRDVVSSALRELKEEAGISPDARGLSRRGVLSFHFLDTPAEVWETHLFSGEGVSGGQEPEETEEMEPRWFGVENVPYEQMWKDDRFWLPSILGSCCDERGNGAAAAEEGRKNVIGEFWVSLSSMTFFLPPSLLSGGRSGRGREVEDRKLTAFFFSFSLFLLDLFRVHPQKKNTNKTV